MDRTAAIDVAGPLVAVPDPVIKDLYEEIEELYRRLADAEEVIEVLHSKIDEVDKVHRKAWWILSHMTWKQYDTVYYVWKGYRRREVARDEALKKIDAIYSARLFFLLYPFYKITKPLRKLWISLTRKCARALAHLNASAVEPLPSHLFFQPRPHKLRNIPAGLTRKAPRPDVAPAPQAGEDKLRLRLYDIKSELAKALWRERKYLD